MQDRVSGGEICNSTADLKDAQEQDLQEMVEDGKWGENRPRAAQIVAPMIALGHEFQLSRSCSWMTRLS